MAKSDRIGRSWAAYDAFMGRPSAGAHRKGAGGDTNESRDLIHEHRAEQEEGGIIKHERVSITTQPIDIDGEEGITTVVENHLAASGINYSEIISINVEGGGWVLVEYKE